MLKTSKTGKDRKPMSAIPEGNPQITEEKSKELRKSLKAERYSEFLLEDQHEGLDTDQFQIGTFVQNAQPLTAMVNLALNKPSEVPLQNIPSILARESKAINEGDLTKVEAMLYSQAKTLEVTFAEMLRRAVLNTGKSEYRAALESYFKMAMRAQNQCRMTLETLGAIKNPPILYAKQANISNGPQQVNNGIASSDREMSTVRAGARAGTPAETLNRPVELLGEPNEQGMDTGTQGKAKAGNSKVEAMGEIHRTQDTRRKSQISQKMQAGQ